MANPARDIRERVQQQWPGASAWLETEYNGKRGYAAIDYAGTRYMEKAN